MGRSTGHSVSGRLNTELPETIEQQNISNDESMNVLHKHQSNFSSDDFWHDFLETTPNGKSTARVAQDLGLKIDRLTVKHYDKEVDKIVIDEKLNIKNNLKK